MPPLANDQIGFASVSLSTGVYTQLPNIPCQEIWVGQTILGITIAGSASPGANVIVIASGSTAAAPVWTMIPTGGNANNLFMTAGGTVTLAFMWRNPRTQFVGQAA